MLINHINFKKEVHNNKALELIDAIKDAIKKSGLPMRVIVRRVPVSRDLNFCNIVVTGDAFNFEGVATIRKAMNISK